MAITSIPFDAVLSIWVTQLWPGRKTEGFSNMLLFGASGDNASQPRWFYGYLDGQRLVGVNSCHLCVDGTLRSRGLWVSRDYRGRGIGTQLLRQAVDIATYRGCPTVWSFPRMSALPVYQRAGFEQGSDPVASETSPANCYALLRP